DQGIFLYSEYRSCCPHSGHGRGAHRSQRITSSSIVSAASSSAPQPKLSRLSGKSNSNYPHQLSGGMSQRVMIAMAMSNDPKLLIADEPTTALDVTIQAQILDLMKKIQKEEQSSILLITHDLGVVAEMCSRVIVMYAGKIVEEAPVETLFGNPSHPYTQGLIASVPKLGSGVKVLPSIPGSVPDLAAMPEGCRFAPRCKYATDKCRKENPELFQIGENHKCRCWLVQDK
ncbi:MAG: ABC transporter ATP-binding protein, partial [Lachnospiraceae bacterium]|nr:ABC transporter ATP-binding protein [Lachnospiraceae bacterium]